MFDVLNYTTAGGNVNVNGRGNSGVTYGGEDIFNS
jgi:hypothetical protein